MTPPISSLLAPESLPAPQCVRCSHFHPTPRLPSISATSALSIILRPHPRRIQSFLRRHRKFTLPHLRLSTQPLPTFSTHTKIEILRMKIHGCPMKALHFHTPPPRMPRGPSTWLSTAQLPERVRRLPAPPSSLSWPPHNLFSGKWVFKQAILVAWHIQMELQLRVSVFFIPLSLSCVRI